MKKEQEEEIRERMIAAGVPPHVTDYAISHRLSRPIVFLIILFFLASSVAGFFVFLEFALVPLVVKTREFTLALLAEHLARAPEREALLYTFRGESASEVAALMYILAFYFAYFFLGL